MQDISEPENMLEEFEPAETNLLSPCDNSNDENDVDDETMSGTILVLWIKLVAFNSFWR